MPPAAVPQELIDQFVAASHGDLHTVRSMLEAGPALLTASARWRETPLQAASHAGSRPVAEYLLSKGAPLDICAAAMLGMADRVREFLRADPAQARATGAHGIPALFHAAVTGQVEVADALVAAGADVNQGEGGNTALHGAARMGQRMMAAWLLDHGAHINALDFEGKTPLRVALDVDHTDMAGLLRERGGQEEGEKTP